MEKKYLTLDDISAYRIAFELSNYVWGIVMKWDFFAKDTVGKQYTRAIDSMSANVAEGFGRYGKKDKVNFYRDSYGSLKESSDWTEKAKIRGLITEEQYRRIQYYLEILPKELHNLIKFTNEKLTI